MTPEVEAFIRFLAMNPHKTDDYLRDPQDFMDATQVSPPAQAVLSAMGPNNLLAMIKGLAEKVLAEPDSGTYGRDDTVQGFGARRPSS
jgi:hypothetical protein